MAPGQGYGLKKSVTGIATHIALAAKEQAAIAAGMPESIANFNF